MAQRFLAASEQPSVGNPCEDRCARRRVTQFSPALGAARARGIGGRGSAAAEAAATGVGVSRFWCRLGGLVAAAFAAGKLATPPYPALALRRARGWIMERAFARIQASAGVRSRWVTSRGLVA